MPSAQQSEHPFNQFSPTIQENLPLLELLQACLSELFNKVWVNTSMPLSLLLFILCESIVGVHTAIAVHTVKHGPEYIKDRNPLATVIFKLRSYSHNNIAGPVNSTLKIWFWHKQYSRHLNIMSLKVKLKKHVYFVILVIYGFRLAAHLWECASLTSTCTVCVQRQAWCLWLCHLERPGTPPPVCSSSSHYDVHGVGFCLHWEQQHAPSYGSKPVRWTEHEAVIRLDWSLE